MLTMKYFLERTIIQNRFTPACLLISIMAILSGCISTDTPNDLTFRSVNLVDWKDQSELPGPLPELGIADLRALVASGHSLSGGVKWHRPLLKIEFTSTVDLPRFASKNGYNLMAEDFLCGHGNGSAPIGFPGIFLSRFPLDERNLARMPFKQTLASYHIFVDVAGEARPQDIPPREKFDLRQTAADVCFYARGGGETGFGYRSNMVMVPKAAIAKALQKTS